MDPVSLRQRQAPAPGSSAPGPLPRRLLWFVALWVAGVLSVAIVGYGIKLMLNG